MTAEDVKKFKKGEGKGALDVEWSLIKEEFKQILDVTQRFAKKEIAKGILDIDLEPNLDWTRSIWEKSKGIGLPGLLIPEEFGGIDQSEAYCALVLDTLASECAGVASVFVYHFAAVKCMLQGSKEQKEKYLPLLANVDSTDIGSIILPPYLTENQITVKEKKGKIVLSGASSLTGNAELAKYFCVFLDEGADGKAITCVIVDRDKISLGEHAGLPGLKVNPFAPIIFKDVEIDPGCIVGERGKGKDILEATQNLFYGLIAGVALGSARTAYRKARTYAEERYQYGKNIIYHQEIQRMLGNMLAKLSVGTSAYTQALIMGLDTGILYSSPSARFAKIFCTDAALEIVIDAIQVHGGYGYMHEYGVEKIFRDVKVLHLLGGSSPAMHVQTIAREL